LSRPLVVLLNFGGPRGGEEVEDFLFEILRDPNTIQLPVPRLVQDALARRVARRRAPETRRQYGEIGGRSPIVEDSERIAEALGRELEAVLPGGAPPIRVAHRYLPGWTRALAREIVAEGFDDLFAVPLYPHFSYASTGSSLEQLGQELEAAGFRGRLTALRSYPDDPRYLDALASRLRETLERSGVRPEDTVILCSAHGLPRRYVERGDPYRLELYRTLEPLRERFAGWRIDLSFQSRVGPMEWLRPYTDQYIPALAEQGMRDLVFLPISFVNDHIETLYEIGHTYFEAARRAGMRPHRVPAVADHPDHIRALAGAVARWRAGQGGVPAAELMPPGQDFARCGVWLWGAWGLALLAALLNAWCR
jgi:ferrochelatase